MILSNLVNYRNKIIELQDQLSLQEEISSKLVRFSNLDSPVPETNSIVQEISKNYNDISKLNSQLELNLSNLIQQLDSAILAVGLQLEKDSDYVNRFNEFAYPIGLLDPYQTPDQQYLTELQQQLTQHALWKYPGLQLYPQSKQWTDVMLANDPVYLVALSKKPLTEIIQPYPALYQNRLRLYACSETGEDVDRSLNFLPKEQFGYCVMWNISLYLASDYLNQYIKSIFNLLRPGGVCIFNYNNCTITASAKLAEEKIFSFLTPSMLEQMAKDAGFETVTFKDEPLEGLTYTHVSWVELRKAGTLVTAKSHQTLAQIIEK